MKIIKSKKITLFQTKMLISDIETYEHIVFVGEKTFRLFDSYYFADVDGEFAGVLCINRFGSWTKFGPFVLRKKFQGKGIGSKLFAYAVNHESGNLYVGSSNPAVLKLVTKHEFTKCLSYKDIPWQVRLIYLKMSWYVVRSFETVEFLKELVRKKRVYPARGRLRHFYKLQT